MFSYRFFKRWLLFAFVVTILCGMIEWAVQQNYRMSANDPQIQLAEDAARKLENGAQPASVVPNEKIDIAQSLAPFVIVYDAQYQVLATSGMLDNQAPQLPTGVYSFVSSKGQDRITWQPKTSVREAAIVVPVSGQQKAKFVVAARSLKEVEKREDTLVSGITLGWVALLVGTPFLLWIFTYLGKQLTLPQKASENTEIRKT